MVSKSYLNAEGIVRLRWNSGLRRFRFRGVPLYIYI